MKTHIKVLIVDDSKTMRDMLRVMLESDPDIEVVGVAVDPYEAREKIKTLNPDVLTLDVEMPKMDGLSFLEKIMALRPMPVVMISTLTDKGAETTLRALEIGAVDYMAKPVMHDKKTLEAMRTELILKVKGASRAKLKRGVGATAQSLPRRRLPRGATDVRDVIAIGASTGGVEALRDVLSAMPDGLPPILVVQHMPERFTPLFASRLDKICAPTVKEARDGEVFQKGCVYIAAGGRHMEALRTSGGYCCKTHDEELVSGHRPSADTLFFSVAKAAGRRALGVILTGMGKDGAEGLLAMRTAGAATIGQDEASCVVYGMPHVAFMRGAVEEEAALANIPDMILARCASH